MFVILQGRLGREWNWVVRRLSETDFLIEFSFIHALHAHFTKGSIESDSFKIAHRSSAFGVSRARTRKICLYVVRPPLHGWSKSSVKDFFQIQ